MYADQIKAVSLLKEYRRKTYLGQPALSSFDSVFVTEMGEEGLDDDIFERRNHYEVGNKLSPEEMIDDYEIRS